jgi:hypothetical protein
VTEMTLMTLTEYARKQGVAMRVVKEAIDTGRIRSDAVKLGSNKRKLIIVSKADATWNQSVVLNNSSESKLSAQDSSGEDEDSSPPKKNSLVDYRTVREGYNAKMAQLAYEEKIGSLIDADKVRRAVREVGMSIKNALLNIPGKLSPILAAESEIDKIDKLLTDEIHIVLTNLSRGDYEFNSRDEEVNE